MVRVTIQLAVRMLSACAVCALQWAVMAVWFVIIARSSGHDAKAVYDVYADLYAPANWLQLADDGVGLRQLASAVDELFQVSLRDRLLVSREYTFEMKLHILCRT
jgi:hypothetical protein